MTNKAYFNESIRSVIIEKLNKAEDEIYVAVAWFNDIEIFNILVEKAGSGKKVELLISNDPNNFDQVGSLNFLELIEKGGKVNRLITENVMMHNKFCVVDNHTLITGSYNWTFGAFYKNLENVVVIENDIKLCELFKAEYHRIISEYFAYIKEFDTLLQKIQDRVAELRDQNKLGLLDPDWIVGILNKNPAHLFLKDGKEAFDSSAFVLSESGLLTDWWDSLPSEWRLYFNDQVLPNGRVNNTPSDDALQFLKNLEEISCDRYWTTETWNNRTKTKYYLKSIEGLETISKLKKLSIVDCGFTQSSIESLDRLQSLINLDLRSNKINALSLNHKMPNLIELDISNNEFESLDFLHNLPNLEILHCYSNKLTGTKGLERAKNLRILYMDKAVYDLPFVKSKLLDLKFEKVHYESKKEVKLERG